MGLPAHASRLSRVVLAIGAGAVIMFLIAPEGSAWQTAAFSLPLLLALVTVAARAATARVASRGPLLVLLGGISLYTAASAVWYWAPVVFHRTLPFPSPVDATFFASYGAYALFLLLVLRHRTGDKDVESKVAVTDALILTTALSSALWVAVIGPNLEGGYAFTATAAAVAYPALTLVLFALAVRFAVLGGFARTAPGVLLLLWIGAEIAGDIVYGYQGANGTFEYASPLTTLWIVSLTALAALASHPDLGDLIAVGSGSARKSTAPQSTLSSTLRSTRSVVLLLASLFPLAFAAVEGSFSLVLLGASGLTFMLGSYRTSLLSGDLLQQRRLTQDRDEAVERLRQANTDLKRATEAKSTFLATMSHEIRTPMNAIIGMTGLLRDTPLSEYQSDYVETVHNAGDNLLAIINDILDFSKIEAGQLDLEDQPFDLAQCVESAVDLVAAQATAKGLELLYLLESDCPKAVRGDVTRFRQILLNLLSNAVKFTAAGEVVLRASCDSEADGYLRFQVTDTGIGIPSDRLDRLFLSFSQVDASTTRSYGGTGLGLAVSRRLAEAMDGRMWVESAVGRGSTFSFTCRLPTHHASLPQIHRLPDSHLTGKRVLVVDDNETNRRILDYQLGAWGMLCEGVDSADAALALLQEGRSYDAAILDMHMPGMDGEALAIAIRQQPSGNILPLIMLTSLGHRERRTGAANFHTVLTKPVKPSGLFEALAAAVAASSRHEEVAVAKAVDSGPVPVSHQLRILVAEDNPVNQKVALRILERLGHRADVASNGREAVESVRRQRYDVVLMDVQMPELDGLDATRRIRAELPGERQPHIIAMTANAFAEDRASCLSAGMDDYLSKPVRMEALAAVLGAHTDRVSGTRGGTREVGHV